MMVCAAAVKAGRAGTTSRKIPLENRDVHQPSGGTRGPARGITLAPLRENDSAAKAEPFSRQQAAGHAAFQDGETSGSNIATAQNP